ncbi:MAG TPA: glycosyltransferase [Ilumatobacteraceae bacterium]
MVSPSTAPRISFAVPYHSNPDFLRQAIDSVLAQTTPAWDLVIVDDAGPHDARAMVEAIGDPRIRYVRNAANLGLAENWNECLRLTNAPLVTILHADDRLRPGYASAVIAAADGDPTAVAVFTDAEIIGPDGTPTISLPDLGKRLVRRPRTDYDLAGDHGLSGLAAGNYMICPTLCYRRALLGEHGFDGRWRFMVDLDSTARLLFAGEHMRAVRTKLYEYRRHDNTQTTLLTADTERFEEEIAFARELGARATTIGWTRTARAARRRLLLRMHMLVRGLIDVGHGRFTAARGKWRMLVADLRSSSPRSP